MQYSNDYSQRKIIHNGIGCIFFQIPKYIYTYNKNLPKWENIKNRQRKAAALSSNAGNAPALPGRAIIRDAVFFQGCRPGRPMKRLSGKNTSMRSAAAHISSYDNRLDCQAVESI
jgi:hypothetical protein